METNERRHHADMGKGADIYADQAVARFVSLDGCNARVAEDIQSAKFREQGEASIALRAKIRALLVAATDTQRTAEHFKLLENLQMQYERAIAVWTDFFTFGKTTQEHSSAVDYWLDFLQKGGSRSEFVAHYPKAFPPPPPGRVKVWLDSLSVKTLDGILEFNNSARLILMPGLPAEDFRILLRRKGSDINMMHQDYFLNPGYAPGAFSIIDLNLFGISGWRIAITDGRPSLPPVVNYELSRESGVTTLNNETIVMAAKAYFQKRGLNLMPPYAYIPTAMDAMAEGKQLDSDNTFTAFPEAYAKVEGTLATSRCRGSKIILDLCSKMGAYDPTLRCRPWIEGGLGHDKLKANGLECFPDEISF